MIGCVIDNSVAMRWEMPVKPEEVHLKNYAQKVLDSLKVTLSVVPWFWHIEAANVLARAERNGELTVAQVTGFLARLEAMEIETYTKAPNLFAPETMGLLRRHRQLSAYDAAYLALAMRLRVPLATNDTVLLEVAPLEGVALYLGGPTATDTTKKKPRKLK